MKTLTQHPVVVSLGGSMLFHGDAVDADYVRRFASLALKLKKEGLQLVLVVGGGRTARDYARAARELTKNEFLADRVAIATTRVNALLVITALGEAAAPKVVTDFDEAAYALHNGLIPVGAGMLEGITTDADAVLIAEQLKAARVVNVSNVDAIYSTDPKKDPKAKRLTSLTHHELVQLAAEGDDRRARSNFVFDLLACKLAARSSIELHFVTGAKLDEVEKAIRGEKHGGTVVTG